MDEVFTKNRGQVDAPAKDDASVPTQPDTTPAPTQPGILATAVGGTDLSRNLT